MGKDLGRQGTPRSVVGEGAQVCSAPCRQQNQTEYCTVVQELQTAA